MVHLSKYQYSSLKKFSTVVRRELMVQRLNKSISTDIVLLGQEYGFCNEEIEEIVEMCYEDLVRLAH